MAPEPCGAPGAPRGTDLAPDASHQVQTSVGMAGSATASTDSTVRLWDVETGKPVGKPLTGNGFILSTAFSPDGHLLAAGAHGSLDNMGNTYLYGTSEPSNPLTIPSVWTPL